MMRVSQLALMFSAIIATVSGAQQPIAVPGSGQPSGMQPGGIPLAGAGGQAGAVIQVGQAAAVDPALLAHLQAWEKRMKEIENVVCEVDKIEKDNVLKREFKRVGKIYVMKPNYAWLRLDRDKSMPADPNDFQTWICDGKAIYQYEGRQKEMTEFKLSPNGGIQGNLLFEFMSGSMTADMALRRFDMKLLGQDANYVHIEILPRMPNDKTEFERMTLTLVSPGIAPQYAHLKYLPAAVSMTKNNNRESETWQFTRNAQVNVQGLRAEVFMKAAVPKEWKTTIANPLPTSAPYGPRSGK
jgi:TIGR03009 family protein